MANSNPRQYASGLVNIVGINNLAGAARPLPSVQAPQNPTPNPQPFSVPEYANIPDVTDDKIAQMQNDSERRYQIVMESMKAQSNIRQAALQAKGVPQRHLELAGIFDTIANAGLKYLEYEKETQAAKQDQERQRNAMMARAALEEITINAQSNIRQYGMEHGLYTTRDDARRVLEYYSQVLPPEEMVPLYTFYGTELRQLEQLSTNRYFEAAQEEKEASINLVKAQVNYEVSRILGSMSNPALSVQQADQLFSQAYDYILQNTSNLDPTARLEILADALTPFANASTQTHAQRVAIQQRQFDLYNFIPKIAELREQFAGNDEAFRYALWYYAPESIQGLLADIPDSRELLLNEASRAGAVSSLQGFEDEQRRREIASQGLRPQDISAGLETAYRMVVSGDSAAQAALGLLQSKDKSDLLPHEVITLQFVEQWQNDQREFSRIREELANANSALAGRVIDFPAQTAPRTQVYVDQGTGIAYQLEVERPDGSKVFMNEELTPEQRDALRAQVDIANSEVQRLQGELQDLLNRSARSGFDLTRPTNRAYIDGILTDLTNQEAIQTYGSTEQTTTSAGDGYGNPNFRVTETVPNAPAQTFSPGTSAPRSWTPGTLPDSSGFSWSADQSPPGYPSGQSPVAPLARSGNHVIPFSHTRNGQITATSGYGDRVHPIHGDVRLHAGADYSGDVLYQEDVGAVGVAGGHVLAAWDWNGYGGTVLVQTPEGYIEQYSHLRSFMVKPGDYVRPGQPVGVVGGDSGDPMPGYSTGRHLHFQVWQPGTTQYTNPTSDTIDPEVYLASVAEFEEQPRGANVGYSPHSGATSYTPTPNALPDGHGNWFASINSEQYPYLSAFLNQGGGMSAISAAQANIPQQPISGGIRGDGSRIQQLVNTALESSGTSFNAGVAEQCAIFIRDVFARAGIDIGITTDPVDNLDTSAGLANSFFGSDIGTIIRNPNQLQPGDIVGFANTYGDWSPGTITHVGIYTGDGMMIDRPTREGTVMHRPINEFDLTNFVAVRPYTLQSQSWNSNTVPVEEVYQPSAPQSTGRMAGTRASYPARNDPAQNYGYTVLRDDREFRLALTDVANQLDIPAVWLADLMAFESGHSWNPGRIGDIETHLGRGVGLIQAMSGGVLADWGLSVSEVASMSRAQYTRDIAYRYLKPFAGQIHSVVDLASAVLYGYVGAELDGEGDGHHSLRQYVQRLGEGANRSYNMGGGDIQTVLGSSHESYTQGCPTCAQQVTRYGAIIPHER